MVFHFLFKICSLIPYEFEFVIYFVHITIGLQRHGEKWVFVYLTIFFIRFLMATQATQDDWQLVTRRKRYPDGWRATTTTLNTSLIKPYVPFSHTYAQAVARPPRTHVRPNPTPTHPVYTKNSPLPITLPALHPTMTTKTATSPSTSPPSSPNNRPNTATYISPHSPTALRFPPSPLFKEWRGRCFRCCRTGHVAASCQFPAKCGKCWSDGHVGSRCSAMTRPLNAQAKPFILVTTPQGTTPTVKTYEPDFESMITGTFPHVAPDLPEASFSAHTCFLERDEEYYNELERLQRAIVVSRSDPTPIEKIAELLVQTGMV